MRQLTWLLIIGWLLLTGCFYKINVHQPAFYYKLDITVTDMASSRPVNEASVRIKDNLGQIAGQGKTDAQGTISILTDFYDHSRVDTVVWPFTFHSRKLLKYFEIFIKAGTVKKRVKVALKDFERLHDLKAWPILLNEEFNHAPLYAKKIEIKIKP